MACGQVPVRTTHCTLSAAPSSTLGRGKRPDDYGAKAMADGRRFILAQFQSVGASLRGVRGQAGVLTVAMLEPLVGREASIEGQDLNPYADGTSSAPGWVAQ